VNATAAAIGSAVCTTMSRLAEFLSKTPLLGGIAERYDAHYDAANDKPTASSASACATSTHAGR